MANCPVCNNEYVPETDKKCNVCDWDLTPYPATFAGQIPQAFIDKERAKLVWARKIWAKSKNLDTQFQKAKIYVNNVNQQQEELQNKFELINQEKSKIEAQVSRYQLRITQLNQYCSQLKSQLNQASQERLYLQEQVNQKLIELKSQLNIIRSQGADNARQYHDNQTTKLQTVWQNSINNLLELFNNFQRWEHKYLSLAIGIFIIIIFTGFSIFSNTHSYDRIGDNFTKARVSLRGNDIPVNLRNEPKINQTNILSKLPDGTDVKILQVVPGEEYNINININKSNNWYKVDANGQQGYVASYYLKLEN